MHDDFVASEDTAFKELRSERSIVMIKKQKPCFKITYQQMRTLKVWTKNELLSGQKFTLLVKDSLNDHGTYSRGRPNMFYEC